MRITRVAALAYGAACVANALTGCATILGLEHKGPSADGGVADVLSPARDAASPLDAGQPNEASPDTGALPQDAGAHDAGAVDARAEDAGVVDAGAVDGCEGGYCACSNPGAFFCDDFDESDAYAPLFPHADIEGGSVSVVLAVGASPPHALRSGLNPPPAMPSAAFVWFDAPVMADQTQLSLSFEFQLQDCLPSEHGDTVASILLNDSFAIGFQLLSADMTAEHAKLAVVSGELSVDFPVVIGKWADVSLLLNLTASQAVATVDGVQEATSLTGAPGSVNTVQVSIGQEGPAASACGVLFDNVVFNMD